MIESTLDHTLAVLIRRAHSPNARDSFAAPAPEDIAWDELVEEADRQGVAGVLYFALRRASDIAVPPETLAALERLYKRHHLDNWLRGENVTQLIAELEAAQIPVMVLKGAALASLVYPDIGLRPFIDVDLLLRPQDQARAQELVQARGADQAEAAEGFGEIFNGQTAYLLPTAPPVRVDLHWQLFIYNYYARRIPDEWWWQHTMPFILAGTRTQTLDPLAQMIYLTAHAALHHRRERLIWSYDLAQLVEKYSSELRWDELVRRSQEFGLSAAVRTGLERAVALWDAPVPSPVLTALANTRRDLRSRLVYRLATAPHWEARTLLDGASPGRPQTKVAFWLHHLFPPRAYMYRRYKLTRDRQLLWYYPGRVGAVAFKFFRSLWSTAQNN